MRILHGEPGRAIARHGEIRLGPGGVLGRHPAVVSQLVVIVEGQGTCNDEGVGAGDIVHWEAGEEHETRTEAGLVALVIEAESLRVR